MADEKGRPISLRLGPELLAELDEAVDGGDRTAWIKGAIRMRLDNGKRAGGGVGRPLPVQLPPGGRKLARKGRTVPPLARSTRAAFAQRRR